MRAFQDAEIGSALLPDCGVGGESMFSTTGVVGESMLSPTTSVRERNRSSTGASSKIMLSPTGARFFAHTNLPSFKPHSAVVASQDLSFDTEFGRFKSRDTVPLILNL